MEYGILKSRRRNALDIQMPIGRDMWMTEGLHLDMSSRLVVDLSAGGARNNPQLHSQPQRPSTWHKQVQPKKHCG